MGPRGYGSLEDLWLNLQFCRLTDGPTCGLFIWLPAIREMKEERGTKKRKVEQEGSEWHHSHWRTFGWRVNLWKCLAAWPDYSIIAYLWDVTSGCRALRQYRLQVLCQCLPPSLTKQGRSIKKAIISLSQPIGSRKALLLPFELRTSGSSDLSTHGYLDEGNWPQTECQSDAVESVIAQFCLWAESANCVDSKASLFCKPGSANVFQAKEPQCDGEMKRGPPAFTKRVRNSPPQYLRRPP